MQAGRGTTFSILPNEFLDTALVNGYYLACLLSYRLCIGCIPPLRDTLLPCCRRGVCGGSTPPRVSPLFVIDGSGHGEGERKPGVMPGFRFRGSSLGFKLAFVQTE